MMLTNTIQYIFTNCHFIHQGVTSYTKRLNSCIIMPRQVEFHQIQFAFFAVQQFPVPKECRQFVGLTFYYCLFVKDFAGITQPLHNLTQKTDFSWLGYYQVLSSG